MKFVGLLVMFLIDAVGVLILSKYTHTTPLYIFILFTVLLNLGGIIYQLSCEKNK